VDPGPTVLPRLDHSGGRPLGVLVVAAARLARDRLRVLYSASSTCPARGMARRPNLLGWIMGGGGKRMGPERAIPHRAQTR